MSMEFVQKRTKQLVNFILPTLKDACSNVKMIQVAIGALTILILTCAQCFQPVDISKHLKNAPIASQTKKIAAVFFLEDVLEVNFMKPNMHRTCQNASICATRIRFVFGALFLMTLEILSATNSQPVETFNNQLAKNAKLTKRNAQQPNFWT